MEAGQTIVDSKADRLNIVWSPCYSTYSSLRSSSSSFMFNDHSWSMTIIGCLSSDQHFLTTSRPYTFKHLSQLSLGTVTARDPLLLEHDIMEKSRKIIFLYSPWCREGSKSQQRANGYGIHHLWLWGSIWAVSHHSPVLTVIITVHSECICINWLV